MKSFAITALLCASILLTGCRTYGGYGSEDAALQQIEVAYEKFQRDLAQARNDLRAVAALEAAAESPIPQRMEAIVAAHETLLERHAGYVEEARENAGNYRTVSRILRGMMSEQESVYRLYRALTRDAAVSADTALAGRAVAGSPRYHVVPPYYERVQNASQLSPVGSVSRAMSTGGTSASVAPADTTGAGIIAPMGQ